LLILHGLRVATGEDEEGQHSADIVWRTKRVASLPAEPGAAEPIAIVRGERTGSGTAIVHVFGYDGRVRCRFRVDANGSSVSAWARPEVTERDLFSLFAEPVMRTVLVSRQLLSFHAAALAKDGRAILIMAAKGAGKSTFSWALQGQGWQLLADDLVRTEDVDGLWSAFAGHRDTKLTPGAVRALGCDAQALLPRFDDPGPASTAILFDKLVVDPIGGPPPTAAVPLTAILFLTPRDPALTAMSIHRLQPVAGIRSLVEHATANPIAPETAPGLRFRRDIGSIASRVPMAMLTLPDSLDRLAEAATALEAQLNVAAEHSDAITSV
jgi:hypothetical protein